MNNINSSYLVTPHKSSTINFHKVKTYKLIRLIQASASNLLTYNFLKDHMTEIQVTLFQIEVENSYKKWTIIKRFDDFIQLKKDLPQKYSKQIRAFPVQKISDLPQSMTQNLLEYFCFLLSDLAKKNIDILTDITFNKFIYNLVPPDKKQMKVYFQVKMNKKAWGRHNQSRLKKAFHFFASWESRFFTITAEGIHFTQSQNNYQIFDNLFFTSTFSYTYGQKISGHSYGITINSSHRVLQAYLSNVFDMVIFVHFLAKAIDQNKNLKGNRFNSFARIQDNCQAKYYIDGQDYFEDVYDALLLAQKEIFIVGWMISPYLLLKRPDQKEESRLDKVLQKVAKSGVKINIIIYNAPKLALNLDSDFTQSYLNSLSENIKVLTHPHYVLIPFLWSPHQKMIVIDQKIGFMGGLDLGYGRLDSKQHFLTDLSSQFWPGVDYCNYRTRDIVNPKSFTICSIDRNSVPRMPWHDIGVRLTGASVSDMVRHFIQYWNYANVQLSMDNRQLLMFVGLGQKDLKNTSKQQKIHQYENLVKQNRHAIRRAVKSMQQNFGIDFLNRSNLLLNKKQISLHQKRYQESQFQRKMQLSHIVTTETLKSAQMQKQFYACYIQQSLEQQNMAKLTKKLTSPREVTTLSQIILCDTLEYANNTLNKWRQKHQILRSVSKWSHGLQEHNTQNSIQNAYIELIQNSEEHIYIENQFFISVDNRVTVQLCKRIIKAYQLGQKYRVTIILPALPGFEGHPADQNGAAVFRVQIYLHLQNIKNLYKGLEFIPNIREYLYFFSLRTHSYLNQQPVTEIIYVHSKLMIVDDRTVLVGSANINDRSLMGNRDTELAVVIEDTQLKQIKVNNRTRMVSKFAHELRKQLYMQHFSINDSEATDYLNDEVWDCIIRWSERNHQIYRDLFGCYPDNEMKTFQDMDRIKNKADSSKYAIFKDIIKGHSIPFQFGFLQNQNLALNPTQKEYFLPKINFH